jgi:hypothetical protein
MRESPLVKEADALVDAYPQVLERALTTYQGRIKPDEVRSLLLSAYIQRRQLSTFEQGKTRGGAGHEICSASQIQ